MLIIAYLIFASTGIAIGVDSDWKFDINKNHVDYNDRHIKK